MAPLSRTDQYASTRRDPRLSHNCDCFDRSCGQASLAMSFEFPATFAVISMGHTEMRKGFASLSSFVWAAIFLRYQHSIIRDSSAVSRTSIAC
jgi:hypothetical protein